MRSERSWKTVRTAPELSLERQLTEFAQQSVCSDFDHFLAQLGQKNACFGPQMAVVTFPAQFCLDIDLRLRENPTAERSGTGKKQGIFLRSKTSHGTTRNRPHNFEKIISNWL